MKKVINFRNINVPLPEPYEMPYMKFTARENGTTVRYTPSTYASAEYSYDGANWQNFNNKTVTLSNGSFIYVKTQCAEQGQTDGVYQHIDVNNGSVDIDGELTLRDTIYKNEFREFFWNGTTKIYSLPNISKVKTVQQHGLMRFAYQQNVTELKEGFLSNVETVENGAFNTMLDNLAISYLPFGMFEKLTNIQGSPFYQMFYTCKQLSDINALYMFFENITEVHDYEFQYMFYNCGDIELWDNFMANVTTIGVSGCNGMFQGSIKSTGNGCFPNLVSVGNDGLREAFYKVETVGDDFLMSFTTVGSNGCFNIFGTQAYDTPLKSVGNNYCASIEKGGETLFNQFAGKKHLETIGENFMPSYKKIQGNGYYWFVNCTSLTSIGDGFLSGLEELNSRDGVKNAFQNCSSLEKSPTNLFSSVSRNHDGNFSLLFNGCTNLNEVWFGIPIPNGMYFTNWLDGTSGGTVHISADSQTEPPVPDGWVVVRDL